MSTAAGRVSPPRALAPRLAAGRADARPAAFQESSSSEPGADVKRSISLTVNGVERQLDVQDNWLLSDVLREQLKLYGVREGCGTAVCGSCTVLLDGRPIASCLTLAARLDGHRIETIEGLSQGSALHPIQ